MSFFFAQDRPQPQDSNTMILWHFQNVSDYSIKGHTGATATTTAGGVGTSQLYSTQSKFGGKALFNNKAKFQTTQSGHDDFNSGAGSFTYEFWYYPEGTSRYVGLLCGSIGSNTLWEGIYISTTKISYYEYEGVGKDRLAWDSTGTHSIVDGSWSHIAVVRQYFATGSTWYCFVNGVNKGTTKTAGSYDYVKVNFGANAKIQVGSIDGNLQNNSSGWFDEFRYSKAARYTTNFTPPSNPFMPEQDNGIH